MQRSYFQYWGKADNKYPGETRWHPLAYHSLDVAGVAMLWWDESDVIKHLFLTSFDYPESQQCQLRAWIAFFIALHDLGKFDVRFQLKAPDALASAWKDLNAEDHGLPKNEITGFDHGWAGIGWANREYKQWVDYRDMDYETWEAWQPWLTAVTGHHGDFYTSYMPGLTLDTDETIIDHDRDARSEFLDALSHLFLKPAGLNLQDIPPICSTSGQSWLGGFCAVCDWVGSNTDIFGYQAPGPGLADYLKARLKKIKEKDILRSFGLLEKAEAYKGFVSLLKPDENPRGVQVLVDELPITSGLTLIEASTGSGKTEAALAYAWRLIACGFADSVVFALPTQATANAMLQRAEAFAEQIFGTTNECWPMGSAI